MKKHAISLCIVHIFLAVLILVVQIVSFNRSYYYQQFNLYKVNQKLSISESDLNRSMDHLLDYLEDKTDTLNVEVEYKGNRVEMFNEKEIAHMVDVKDLYQNVLFFMYSGIVSFGIVVALLYKSDHALFDLKESLFEAFLIIGVVLGFTAVFALVDFDSFWTTFHHVFFSNNLWLLNPRTDRMIVMLNLNVFMGLVYRILIYYMAFLSTMTSLYIYLRKKVLRA